jgi:EAL domain-containing protein (putative c-di-GMP-specific phosphodiesterase class I)
VEFLRSQGVDYAQGFHIGHPMPLPEAIEARIDR